MRQRRSRNARRRWTWAAPYHTCSPTYVLTVRCVRAKFALPSDLRPRRRLAALLQQRSHQGYRTQGQTPWQALDGVAAMSHPEAA